MKNIHVLPTDKPSRLWVNNLRRRLELDKGVLIGSNTAQHIYITSDEEIKEGDWYITPNNTVLKALGEMLINVEDYKKIILTTDQELIKEGIQAIDDEFLEWFVKNPSCEEVEVKKEMYMPQSNDKISDGKITQEISLNSSDNILPFYKIIIPKEEPNYNMKQEILAEMEKLKEEPKCLYNIPRDCENSECRVLNKCNGDRVPKQETLEEAAEIYGWKIKINMFSNSVKANQLVESAKQDFIAGAKWQQEKSYNELFEWLAAKDYLSDKVDVIQKEFEQFKKK